MRQISKIARSKIDFSKFAGIVDKVGVASAAAKLGAGIGPQVHVTTGAAAALGPTIEMPPSVSEAAKMMSDSVAATMARQGVLDEQRRFMEKIAGTSVDGSGVLAAQLQGMSSFARASVVNPEMIPAMKSLSAANVLGDTAVSAALKAMTADAVGGSALAETMKAASEAAALRLELSTSAFTAGIGHADEELAKQLGGNMTAGWRANTSTAVEVIAKATGFGIGSDKAEMFRSFTAGMGVVPPSVADLTGSMPHVMESLTSTYKTLIDNGSLTSAMDLVRESTRASWMESIQDVDIAEFLTRVGDGLEVDEDHGDEVAEAPNATAAVCLALITYLALLRSQDASPEVLTTVLGELIGVLRFVLTGIAVAAEHAPPEVKGVLVISDVIGAIGMALAARNRWRGDD